MDKPAIQPEAMEEAWRKRCWLLLAALAVGRWVVLVLLPLDLIADESYYWDWGRRPDWGYFSKPPLIAWIYGLGREMGADSTALVRLPAWLLGMLGLAAMGGLAARWGGARRAFWVMALVAAAPGNVALNLLLTIDAPLLALWALALLALWRWLGEDRSVGGWWPVYAGAVALGVLAKQMMLVLPLLAIAWLAGDPARRERLRRPVVWIGLLAPLVALVPTLAWNAAHGWITARHTADHFAVEAGSWGRVLARLGEFVGLELLLVSPPMAWAWGAAAIGVLRRWRAVDALERFLWVFSVPPLLVVAGLTLRRSPEPNWPAAFWLAGVMLAAWRLAAPERAQACRRALGIGVALAVLTMAAPFISSLDAIRGGRFDPAARLRGWSDWAHAVKARRAGAGAFPLVVGDRAYASALAFYLPEQPRVYLWPRADYPVSQYDLWPGPVADGWKGRDAFIVVQGAEMSLPDDVRQAFTQVEWLGPAQTEIGHGRSIVAQVWRGRALRQEVGLAAPAR